MNHYAEALALLQAQPDHELKQIGDQWQTPKALAWGLFVGVRWLVQHLYQILHPSLQ